MSTQKWGGNDSRKARAHCAPLVASGVACFRCRKPILPGQDWDPDHILDRAHGGTDDPSNLWPSHRRCNQSAGGKAGAAITNAKRNANRMNARGKNAKPSRSFDTMEQPTVPDRFHFILGDIPDLSHVRAAPAILSPWPADTDLAEAELGAKWLGLPLFPQGVEVASVLQAVRDGGRPLYRTAVVEMARRSTKTTAVLATLLGRCLTRDGYKVASTAQTGVKARQKLLEVQAALRAGGFESDGLGTCLQGMGDTRIRFANGSLWQSLPPDPAAFRQEAFDAVLCDEAGELDPEKAEALLAGILPTLDTRPTAQIIVAGTPGEARAGLLWTRLEQLRAGRPRVGGVVYEAPDRSTFIDHETGAVNWELLASVHPGIGTLTDVETIVGNIEDMGLEKWQREYLCLWPLNAGVCALDVAAWEACESDDEPVRPANAAVAFDVDPDGGAAALVAAWRDAAGRACFEVLQADAGYEWLPAAAANAQREHRGAVVFDSIGANLDAADQVARAPHRVRCLPTKQRDQVAAAARFEKEISRRNVVHFGDPELTEGVESSAWRPVNGARLFMRRPGAAALVAAAQALWTYDQRTAGVGSTRRVRTSAAIAAERRLAG